MSIRCLCPKGHSFAVADSLAGRSGLCPVCRTPMKVPLKQEASVSEDAILDILGPQDPSASNPFLGVGEVGENVFRSDVHDWAAPKKSCDRCNKEIPAGTHICPHCHTYIASLHDFH